MLTSAGRVRAGRDGVGTRFVGVGAGHAGVGVVRTGVGAGRAGVDGCGVDEPIGGVFPRSGAVAGSPLSSMRRRFFCFCCCCCCRSA